MFPPGKLGVLAELQLAAWEDIARGWTVYADHDTSRMRCASCHGQIIPMADEHGKLYHWEDGQVLAAKVMHLRAKHPSLDPDR